MPDPVPTRPRRKLIEVDLPLGAISEASIREPTGARGHPFTIHKYWARRTLASCRAVIFATIVDDPADCPDEFPDAASQDRERERLHDILRCLVRWPTANDSATLDEARIEIAKSIARSRGERFAGDGHSALRYLGEFGPAVHDPFAGGGTIPLEAHRLGMRVVATDLNPVSVLVNKALIELPGNILGRHPVNPDARGKSEGTGPGNEGASEGNAALAEDVRYYGRWVRHRALQKVGHLYPGIDNGDGTQSTPTAWLWVRTVPCPNPACGMPMPLLRNFQIYSKAGHQQWIRPVIDRRSRLICFEVQDHDRGVPDVRGIDALNDRAYCVSCRSPVSLDYVREQGQRGNMRDQMLAVVVSGRGGKRFVSPSDGQVRAAACDAPPDIPNGPLPGQALGFRIQAYGFKRWSQMFTNRQLRALAAISAALAEIPDKVVEDGGDPEYANAILTYLACIFGKSVDNNSSFCRWRTGDGTVAGTLTRPVIPMLWDYAEVNPFGDRMQNWTSQVEAVAAVIASLPSPCNQGTAYQKDASSPHLDEQELIVVTDPPYYDNIGYADLSDYYYAWLRPVLRRHYPEFLGSMATPKEAEIVANPRFDEPRQHFTGLMSRALGEIRQRSSKDFPTSIFYAYKQRDTRQNGVTSTGWETMLTALVGAGFQVVGTWPIATDKSTRMRALKSNALAASIILVCRTRSADAGTATRAQFESALSRELPSALDRMTGMGKRESHIPPADLRQAAIGPGMAVYSRFEAVLKLNGEPVTVREALGAVNAQVTMFLQSQAADLDPESQFCLEWLRAHPQGEGPYADAETLASAHNVSVSDRLAQNHQLISAGMGRVRLRGLEEFSESRKRPRGAGGMTAWEACHRMAWHMEGRDGRRGLAGCAEVARMAADRLDQVEALGQILYDIHNNRGESSQAIAFNNLVAHWNDISAEATSLVNQSRLRI